MFYLGFVLGIYGYCIYFLGLLGWLYRPAIIFSLLLLSTLLIIHYKKYIFQLFKLHLHNFSIVLIYKHKLITSIAIFLSLQVLVNLIGVLGPELAFDALWYHLTIPKLFLLDHAIHFIPGNLFYYSLMPNLTEMYYVVALSLSNEIVAKLIHFSFGILCCLTLYLFSKKYVGTKYALLTTLIFYTNLVVSWESITAYIDLARTWYELLALWTFLLWYERSNKKYLLFSAVFIGFAIAIKLLAVGTLGIFLVFLVFFYIKRKVTILHVILYTLIAIAIPLPWFIHAYSATNNPIYPFFTPLYPVVSRSFVNPINFITEIVMVFRRSSDPISPVYLALCPLIIVSFKSLPKSLKIIMYYSGLSLIVWFITPHTGGGRFLLPYLPAYSLLGVDLITMTRKKMIKQLLIGFVIIIAVVNISYRLVANSKYIPVILGKQTKDIFLAERLNFSYGDFYDTDHYFANRITATDKVLLYGFHNLYYVNFPFIDSSFIKKGDRFNYIATQYTMIPSRFRNWRRIYINSKTGVQLYKEEGDLWVSY